MILYMQKNCTIISWNVNGIRAVLKKGFLEFVKTHDPDILCLQETKAEDHQVALDLPQYIELWHSAKRKGYSGTAIFTKTKPLSVHYGFPEDIIQEFKLANDHYGNADEEGRVITAEYSDWFVVNVYTPNSKDDLSRLTFREKQWDPAFLHYLKLLEKTKPIITCGDFNVAHEEIDLARPKDNDGKHGFTDEEREGFTKFIEAGFVDTLRAQYPDKPDLYTWWTLWANARARNVGWRIDYVLASRLLQKKITDAFILPKVLGSDHCPVGIKLKTSN